MSLEITRVSPDCADAQGLINEIVRDVASQYPKESRHGLNSQELLAESVAFFVLYAGGEPAGCGGVKFHGEGFAEIKRLFIRPLYRGQGLGKLMLGHLEGCAREGGLKIIRLQTGVYQREAMGLYERLGYRERPPFGSYQEDPMNRFYEKVIDL